MAIYPEVATRGKLTWLFGVVGLDAAHVGGLLRHKDGHQLVQALFELRADRLRHLLALELGRREDFLSRCRDRWKLFSDGRKESEDSTVLVECMLTGTLCIDRGLLEANTGMNWGNNVSPPKLHVAGPPSSRQWKEQCAGLSFRGIIAELKAFRSQRHLQSHWSLSKLRICIGFLRILKDIIRTSLAHQLLCALNMSNPTMLDTVTWCHWVSRSCRRTFLTGPKYRLI